MELTIRPWQKSDLEAIRRITWQSWMATYSSFIPERDLRSYFDRHYGESCLLAMLEQPFSQGYIIAESGNQIRGLIRLAFHQDENRIYVPSLHVIGDCKGQGIGKKLLEAAEGYAFEKGFEDLWIGVMVKNTQALPFYRKIGFVFVKEEPFTMGRTTVSHLIGFKKIGAGPPLSQKVWTVFDRKGNLPGLCQDLLSEQKRTWQELQKGYQSLDQIKERTLICKGFSIRLQYNPQRIRSSTARVSDGKEIEQPCFLCLNQLPTPQKGILYPEDFLILCNPMPVFAQHFTVSHLDHRHQAIGEHIEIFLQLAADYGKGWIALYNGPRCGASAPNHLHFQIVPSGQMPVEKELLEEKRRLLLKEIDGVWVYRIRDLGREVILLEGEDPRRIKNVLENYLNDLKRGPEVDAEPMVNLAGLNDGRRFSLLIFPRQKHRPDGFYKTGEERMVISPGAIDMGGFLITPVERDFRRLNEAMVESIYREVSIEIEKLNSA